MILCFKAPRAPKAVREPRSYPLAVWKLDFVFDEAEYFLPHWLQTCVPAQDRSNVWFTVPWLSSFWTAVLNNWFWFHMASKRLGGRRRSPLPAHPPHTPPFPPRGRCRCCGCNCEFAQGGTVGRRELSGLAPSHPLLAVPQLQLWGCCLTCSSVVGACHTWHMCTPGGCAHNQATMAGFGPGRPSQPRVGWRETRTAVGG